MFSSTFFFQNTLQTTSTLQSYLRKMQMEGWNLIGFLQKMQKREVSIIENHKFIVLPLPTSDGF